MSTNNECLFFQWEEDKWYYLLEDYNAPKNAWDWRDHAVCYGPFATQEKADADLTNNHANPGGACHSPSPDKTDPVLIEHVKNAKIIKHQTFYGRW
jgi:hypothetical protein